MKVKSERIYSQEECLKSISNNENTQVKSEIKGSPAEATLPPTDFLSKLPAAVIWELICYLDTDSKVALAGVNTVLRELVTVRFHMTLSLPFSSAFSNHLQKNPYSHIKPVLRLRVSHLTPDFIRKELMLQAPPVQQLPITKQLLLLNLSTLTHLCLHLEHTETEDTNNYRLAFLAMIQSIGLLRQLHKLHLMVHQSFLQHLLPENFGHHLMKDGLSVNILILTISGEQSSRDIVVTAEEYRKGLEFFVSLVRSPKLVLNISKEPASTKKTKKILTNEYVECFELVAPCTFQAELKMRVVKELKVSTPGHGCSLPSHLLGKCVLDWRMIRDGCPVLRVIGGLKVKEFKDIRSRRKKEEKVKKASNRTIKVGKHVRRLRCNTCEGCRRPNCGQCRNCKDMKVFGGKGTRAQACEGRKCYRMVGGSVKDRKQGRKYEPQALPRIPVVKWTKFILCTIK